LLATFAGPATSLGAQTDSVVVQVQVRQLGSGAPLTGVVVVALDRAGTTLARALTTAAGTAAVQVASGAEFRLRGERVGYESVESDAMRATASMPPVVLFATNRQVQLAAVAVRGRQRCDRATSDGARATAVWSEARKALTASLVTSADSQRTDRPPILMTRYVRRLGRSMRVERESSSGYQPTHRAFRSAPAEFLSQAGWVLDSGGSQLLYAPDAEVLLSEAFASDHCFRVDRRSGRDSTYVGLRFDPADGRVRPDISGALWLDPNSAELRYLEYRYVNIPDSVSHRMAGGRVEFQRLDDGRWIVSRWYIRSPRLAMVGNTRVGGLSLPRRVEVIGLQEEGGVALLSSVGQRAAAVVVPQAVLTGMVYDSTRAAPLVGALVQLDGTDVIDTTDALGAFELRTFQSGAYSLMIDHPRLASLGLAAISMPVSLVANDTGTLHVVLPSLGTLARRLCPEPAAGAPPSLWLLGLVVDSATRLPIPGAYLSVGWHTSRLGRQGSLLIARNDSSYLDTETDASGTFQVCGVPREEVLRLTVVTPTRAATLRLPASAPGDSVLEVEVVAAPAGRGTLAGLTPATTLAGVRVEAAAPVRGRMAEFERRRNAGMGGRFIDRSTLEKRESSLLSDVLRTHAAANLVRLRGGGYAVGSTRGSGSVDPRSPRACLMQIFLDGIRIFSPSQALGGMPPPSIDQFSVVGLEAVEVYAGPASTPPEFGGSEAACGTVALWTRER